MSDDQRVLLVEILCGIGLVAVVVWIISAGVRSGITKARADNPPVEPPYVPMAPADGPGRFHVLGVDRTTKADKEWTCHAASMANARVRAELEGMIVTHITRIG